MLIILDKPTVGEELTNVFTLIALKLQDFSIFGVLHHRSIAGKFLLTGSHDFLEVVLGGQTLHSSQGFPPVPLLNSDVNQSILNSLVISLGSISERIKSLQIFNGHCEDLTQIFKKNLLKCYTQAVI